MSLRRFEPPSRRDDSRFGLVLSDECRDYISQQAGVDTVRAEEPTPRVDFFAIWRELGAAGTPRPAHGDCTCLRCRGWAAGNQRTTDRTNLEEP